MKQLIKKIIIKQKAPVENQSFLLRRPVELNHIPRNGTHCLSDSDQSLLISASSCPRGLIIEQKNNPSKGGEVIFGLASGNMTLSDKHY